MGVRLTSTENRVCFYDSVTGHAFGPVMDDDLIALEVLDYIEREYGCDPRQLRPGELDEAVAEVIKRREQAEQ